MQRRLAVAIVAVVIIVILGGSLVGLRELGIRNTTTSITGSTSTTSSSVSLSSFTSSTRSSTTTTTSTSLSSSSQTMSSSSTSSSSSTTSTVSCPTVTTTSTVSTRSPVFVWLFGYVGDTFYPQTQLDISTSTVIYLAQGLSSNVGASNLRIVGPVDQEQGHNIQNTTIPTIKSYVDCLRHFASVVYGRIDLEQYNITSSPSLFEVAAMYVNQLDVNGIWFDHAPELYNSSGQFAFNWYMQNITKNFPQLNYLVDQSAAQFHSYITPLSNDTWGTMSYITPTTYASSDNNLSLSKIQDLNKIYPGRVVVHYDAFAGDDTAPMSYFSVQSSAQEVSAVNTLVHEGAFPSSSNQSFSFLFPIIGAWTQNDSMYSGTLYNSLSVGNYYRDTYNNFTQAMITNYVLSPFSPTYSMQYTGAIAIIPLIGLVTLGIKSSRNELLDKFQKIDKANARFVS